MQALLQSNFNFKHPLVFKIKVFHVQFSFGIKFSILVLFFLLSELITHTWHQYASAQSPGASRSNRLNKNYVEEQGKEKQRKKLGRGLQENCPHL